MTFAVVFIGIIAMCLWLAGVVALADKAIDASMAYRGSSRAWMYGLAAAGAFALPIAMFVAVAGGVDAHANELCLAGHQEWRTTHSIMPVGKVMVPTTSTSKAWVCEKWEAR